MWRLQRPRRPGKLLLSSWSLVIFHARIQGANPAPPPLIFGRKKIFTARRYNSAVYGVVECLSVWPSVCLSDTIRHCTKTVFQATWLSTSLWGAIYHACLVLFSVNTLDTLARTVKFCMQVVICVVLPCSDVATGTLLLCTNRVKVLSCAPAVNFVSTTLGRTTAEWPIYKRWNRLVCLTQRWAL